jgi:acyl-CoA thioesterase YciA
MELITTKTALASEMGVSNNLFGGVMLSWLDLSGASYGAQLTDSPRLVTKKFEEVIFEKPVKIGNLIKIYGGNARFGNTSITIDLEARRHNVENGKQHCVCKTTVVFVKINDDGEPVKISDRVKVRYKLRVMRYGRAILTPEEIQNELDGENLSTLDIFQKASLDSENLFDEMFRGGDEATIDLLNDYLKIVGESDKLSYLDHMKSILHARSFKFDDGRKEVHKRLKSIISEVGFIEAS